MQKKKTESGKAATLTVLGASLAGIAATAYFFFGPKGKKHQKIVKAWAIKMKGDVIEKLEKVQEVTEPIYQKTIDTIAAEYTKKAKAGKEEIAELASDLKKHWKTISKEVKAKKK